MWKAEIRKLPRRVKSLAPRGELRVAQESCCSVILKNKRQISGNKRFPVQSASGTDG